MWRMKHAALRTIRMILIIEVLTGIPDFSVWLTIVAMIAATINVKKAVAAAVV